MTQISVGNTLHLQQPLTHTTTSPQQRYCSWGRVEWQRGRWGRRQHPGYRNSSAGVSWCSAFCGWCNFGDRGSDNSIEVHPTMGINSQTEWPQRRQLRINGIPTVHENTHSINNSVSLAIDFFSFFVHVTLLSFLFVHQATLKATTRTQNNSTITWAFFCAVSWIGIRRIKFIMKTNRRTSSAFDTR